MARGPGHFYFTKGALDSVKRIKANDLEWVGGPGGIIFHRLSFINKKAETLWGIATAQARFPKTRSGCHFAIDSPWSAS